jgi:hypothetical protein
MTGFGSAMPVWDLSMVPDWTQVGHDAEEPTCASAYQWALPGPIAFAAGFTAVPSSWFIPFGLPSFESRQP